MPRGIKNELWRGLPGRLRRMRTVSGLSLIELSRRAQLAERVPSYAERGTSVPAIDTVERLAAGLAVDPGWLAFGPEGTEPYRIRRPRDLYPTPMPQPESVRAIFRCRHNGCAARIRAARQSAQLSMSEAAAAAGVTQQTWSNAEAGKHVPKVDSIERMAVALDVPPSWLAYGYPDAGHEVLSDTAQARGDGSRRYS